MYRVIILKRVLKNISKLASRDQPKIFDAIKSLEIDPRPDGVKKLAGNEDMYRIRVGNYRIVYEVDDNVVIVTVTEVDDRKNVYRKK
jgi:mRNA interferase RelE/StbE